MDALERPDALAGAPGTITLGGKTYLVGQCTHADIVAVRKQLKAKLPKPLTMLAECMRDPSWVLLPEDLRRELMRDAGKSQLAGEAKLSDEKVFDLLVEDAELIAFLAWTLIRRADKAVTLEEVKALVLQEDPAQVLYDLYDASGMSSLAKN